MIDLGDKLSTLLAIAWLLPLLGFVIEVFGGYWGSRKSKAAANLAIGCIATGFLCSALALWMWGDATGWTALAAAHGEHGTTDHATQTVFSGSFYTLADFGDLHLSLDYYIDSLTLAMFVMVTFIATCIHVFATGYMAEELVDDYVDHQVHTHDGGHFHRPGRFYKFFSYMSLFCFAMLGLVLAGNIFQVFIFWELVGICSYLLIGFYVERHSASTAANKAFIVNRVGDFGFIIGLMILWTSFGTFSFGDRDLGEGKKQAGLFSMVARGEHGEFATTNHGQDVVLKTFDDHGHLQVPAETDSTRKTIAYTLLIVAGLGVFGGCVGKSAQFPLQTWLPDAMEGPTPVSALVHSATMVAAGVYLAGRFYPVFVPEVLLTIAYVGCITAFVAATIAIVATDIKKVLAYSTISQLGYMMLGLGVGGWAAGLFHLITHAFFKSLMFLCSGSVIAGCHHEQEMTKMGGLLKKMPITALTMLVGVIAIAGLAIPGLYVRFYWLWILPVPYPSIVSPEALPGAYALALSGFHSKDAILATGLAFENLNQVHFLLFLIPLLTAGITSFYMFRLWFYTFLGKPRDQHLHEHVHESPWVMTGPLVVLAFFAAFCAFAGEEGNLFKMLSHSQPAHVAHGFDGSHAGSVSLPDHDAIHKSHSTAGNAALLAAFIGMTISYLIYGKGVVDPDDIKRQAAAVHGFLVNKWGFDDLYDAMFVKPAHVVAKFAAAIDKFVFDEILHTFVRIGIVISKWDRKFDEGVIDGFVNMMGNSTHSMGLGLRNAQTGSIRQYVTFIAISVVTLFVLLFALYPSG